MKKLFEILKLLIKCNFKSSIEKKDIIIYDCVNSFELSKVLTNKKYFILSSRKERIIELLQSGNLTPNVIHEGQIVKVDEQKVPGQSESQPM